jgi:hypothetical protein
VTDAAIALELRRLSGLVEQLLARLAPPLPEPQRRLRDALAGEFGSSPFASREVAAAARSPLSTHDDLRAALAGMKIPIDAEAIGRALRALVKASAGHPVRLVRCGAERGAGVWAIEGIDPA